MAINVGGDNFCHFDIGVNTEMFTYRGTHSIIQKQIFCVLSV